MADASSTIVGIDCAGIVVTDMARSIRFYRALGVTELPADDTTEDHVEGLVAGGFRLMLDREELVRQIDPSWEQPGPGRVALAARCSSPAAVDELYARLDADGHGHRPPWDAPWGQRYASLVDPDGTHVDLYAWLPGRQPS